MILERIEISSPKMTRSRFVYARSYTDVIGCEYMEYTKPWKEDLEFMGDDWLKDWPHIEKVLTEMGVRIITDEPND
jgi:hypothetical protein